MNKTLKSFPALKPKAQEVEQVVPIGLLQSARHSIVGHDILVTQF